ncbi:hypothetical protein ACFLZC_01345 [Patescibacteria group bacterium]
MKKIITIVFLGLILIATPLSGVFALNNDSLDYDTLRVGNITRNPDTTSDYWGTSLFASPGDVLSFAIYYHNSHDQIAKSLRVKLTPKASYKGTTHIFEAKVWADYRQPSYGKVTIWTDEPTTIEHVAGSVKWKPNQMVRDSRMLLNNQNTNNIFEEQGIYLGDIKSGWSYQGNVMVGFKVPEEVIVEPLPTYVPTYVPTPVPPVVPVVPVVKKDISIEKEVFNISKPNGNNEVVGALNGDLIRFTIKVKNIGETMLRDVEIRDRIDPNFRLVNELDKNSDKENTRKLVWRIGSLDVGEESRVFFEVLVAEDAPLEAILRNGKDRTVVEVGSILRISNEVLVKVTDLEELGASIPGGPTGGEAGLGFLGIGWKKIFAIGLIFVALFLIFYSIYRLFEDR